MNKTTILAIVAVFALLILPACSTQTSAADLATGDTQAAENVYGKIKAINGNEILLAIGEYTERTPGADFPAGEWPADGDPAGSPRQRDEAQSSSDADSASDSSSDETDSAPPQNDGANSEAPRGNRGERSGGQGGDRREGQSRPEGSPDRGNGAEGMPNRQGGMNSENVKLTGEEKTYLVPVTAAITAGSGDAASEIRFTQLAVKNIVRLSLDEAGNILQVEVLQ